MRNLVFDLSADSYLSQSDFAGFEGEHNATCLTLILPERLKVEGAEFYLVFELQKSKETVFSAPLFLENGALSLRLPRQLMSSPGTAVYAAAYRREGGELLQIAKSGKVFLEIKEPEDGVLVSFSAEGGTAPGLVIEKEIVSGSRNPLSSDAVYRALEKLATKDSVKNEFSKTEKELSSLKTKDEKTEKEILDLKEENEALQDAIQTLSEEKESLKKEISELEIAEESLTETVATLSEEKDKLNEEILDLKGENDLLSAEMDMLSEQINAQQKEILLSNLTGKVVGENVVRIDDALEEKPEISVKLSGLVNYEPDYVLYFYSTDYSIDISLEKGQGLYTVKSVDTENTKVVFEDDSYIFDDFTQDFCSLFSVGEVVWFDGQVDFYRTAKTPFDYSAVTLKKYGKNLLDTADVPMVGNIDVEEVYGSPMFSIQRKKSGFEFIALKDGNSGSCRVGYQSFSIEPLRGKTITVSFDRFGECDDTNTSACAIISAADDEFGEGYTYKGGNLTNNLRYKELTLKNFANGHFTTSFTIAENETRKNLFIMFYPGYNAVFAEGNRVEYSNIQIEVGKGETVYEPYTEPIDYIPCSDGFVSGVGCENETLTLFSDHSGTKIKVEYRRDLRRVIERMEKAIVSLGGNL